MKQKTFLFFATEVGLAHISRTLSIAEILHKRGHKTIFALPKRRWFIFKNTSVKFVDVMPYIDYESIDIIKVVKNKLLLRKIIQSELRLIQKYKPDIVFVDTRITALCAATIDNRNVVMFGGSNSVPGFSYIPNNALPWLIYKLTKPFSYHFIRLIHLGFFKHCMAITKECNSSISVENLIYNPTYIIPEIEGYFPIMKTPAKYFFVNPPSWNGFTLESPFWLKNIHPNGKTIYLTFGGTGFDGQKLINLADQLISEGYRVIVSTGNLINKKLFPSRKNLFVSTFLPGKEISKRVDIVICHGGYGTLMETIQAGKPFISIPFNPDQMTQSNRLAELKAGLVLQHITLNDILNIFKLDWDKFQEVNSRVTISEILDATNKIIKNYSYYENNIKKINKQFHKIDGAEESADIIEGLT